MSVHSLTMEFGRILRLLDELWPAIANLEKILQGPLPPDRRKALRAASPAWMLDIGYRADGAAWVRINENHEFALSAKLGRFLEILAVERGRCIDGSAKWKTAAAVRAAFTEGATPGRLSPHALNQLAYGLGARIGEPWRAFGISAVSPREARSVLPSGRVGQQVSGRRMNDQYCGLR